jgi:NADH-ubiquinone oxidoreductase chain 2
MLSLFTGSIYGLIQNRLKRLIAYSSISNLGFLLLSVTIENLLGLESFYFYLIQYLFTSINFFLILLSIGYLLFNSLNINKCDLSSPIQILEQIKGLGQRREFIYLSLSLTICLLSFGGIPPFVGFFAKLYVLIASLDYGLLTLTFVAIITSIISMSYYLRIISTLYFTKVEFKQNIGTLSTNYSFMISILTSIIILNICSPNIFINLNQVISFYSI